MSIAVCAVLTSGLIRWILPRMLPRVSATLLIACLLALSGIDLLEDLRSPANSDVRRSRAAQVPQLGQGQPLANDIIESAGRPRPAAFNLPNASAADADCEVVFRSFKPRRLHKLNRVFLI